MNITDKTGKLVAIKSVTDGNDLMIIKVLIAGMDSTFKDKVSVLLFFCPKRNEAMSYILKRDGFGYPVCIDQSDTFNKLNHFLDEMAFQTFLLDRNNRIIALGNPVLNPNIKKLYWNIIQGKDIHCSNKRKKSKINIENRICLWVSLIGSKSGGVSSFLRI